MFEFTQLKVTVSDHVALLTMNAPPVNALTRTLNDELTAALDQISDIDDILAIVLTGEGKVFCAGADLKGRAENMKGPGDLLAHSRRTRECFHAIRECAKPVVVAINGAALGSGLAMVASSDTGLHRPLTARRFASVDAFSAEAGPDFSGPLSFRPAPARSRCLGRHRCTSCTARSGLGSVATD